MQAKGAGLAPSARLSFAKGIAIPGLPEAALQELIQTADKSLDAVINSQLAVST